MQIKAGWRYSNRVTRLYKIKKAPTGQKKLRSVVTVTIKVLYFSV